MHWYGEWSPNGDGTHTAACKRHKNEEKTVDCETVEYRLGNISFKLCPVCGVVSEVVMTVETEESGETDVAADASDDTDDAAAAIASDDTRDAAAADAFGDIVLTVISATADGKGIPSGEVIARKGVVGGETVMSIGFEISGALTQSTGDIEITLPASELNGYTLSVLNADGTENALEYTLDGETAAFTLPFDAASTALLHLTAE